MYIKPQKFTNGRKTKQLSKYVYVRKIVVDLHSWKQILRDIAEIAHIFIATVQNIILIKIIKTSIVIKEGLRKTKIIGGKDKKRNVHSKHTVIRLLMTKIRQSHKQHDSVCYMEKAISHSEEN